MVCDENVETAVDFGCGPGMATRAVHSLVVSCLPSMAAANEQVPWIDADLVWWDAPISVWWDQPPAGET